MTDPHLVVLAGGISSRMKKPAESVVQTDLHREADEKSKAMIGVGEGKRPFLDYLLYNAERAGYRDVVLVVGDHDDAFRQYYGERERDNRFHQLLISYARQSIPPGHTRPQGTADALLQALLQRPEWRGHAFTVCNSDNLYSVHALRLLLETGNRCAMICYDRMTLGGDPARVGQYSVVRIGDNGALVDILEKPTPAEILSATASDGGVGVNMNLFRFSFEKIYPYLLEVPIHPVRREKELPSAVVMMVHDHPGCLKTIPVAEKVPDLTSRNDLVAVREHLRATYPGFSWQ